MNRVTAAAAALLVAVVVVPAAALSAHRSTAAPTLDVLLAFDTTGSMEPSISAAKRDAQSILNAVGAFSPDSHFAVASFRDHFYPGGPYTLVQPMTSSRSALTKALGTLHSVQTNSPLDTYAEAYNLMFHEGYADAHVGWRGTARKIVVVIGDAEPHSAGIDGIAGCTDKTKDWDGLDTASELAKLRAAKRTVVFIRQASTATVSLQCYQSIAALGYEGGAAVDGGSAGVSAPIVALVKRSYAPLTLTAQLDSAVVGRTNGLTVRIANPNGFALSVTALSVQLPAGLTPLLGTRSGSLPQPTADPSGLLTWQVTRPIAPYHVLVGHWKLRVGAGGGSIKSVLSASLPAGQTVTSTAGARVLAVRTAHRATVSVAGAHGTTLAVNGAFSAPLERGAATGRLTVHRGSRAVTLGISGVHAALVGDPTRLRGRVTVASATGLPACKRHTAGTFDLLDSDALTHAGATFDRLTVRLPRSCGGTTTLRDSVGAGLTIKVAFH
jgi:hypothetical protein